MSSAKTYLQCMREAWEIREEMVLSKGRLDDAFEIGFHAAWHILMNEIDDMEDGGDDWASPADMGAQ